MEYKYVSEKNHLILLSLLKAHGIRRVIASPGATNIALVAGMQHDPYFEMHSCVDERSGAYMACGIASEKSTPVVLCCTEGTASRNFYPGLTEAYYRQLPVLVITFSKGNDFVGHLLPQNIDRHQFPSDILKMSVDIPEVGNERDVHSAVVEINKAILALRRRGGGPSHINLRTTGCDNSNIRELPLCHTISYYNSFEDLPSLPEGEIAVFVGSHRLFSDTEIKAIDSFCSIHKAVVLCSSISNYSGCYRVSLNGCMSQRNLDDIVKNYKTIIHIGEISDIDLLRSVKFKEVWRVNPDGELRDTFGCLSCVFEMEELDFFHYYSKDDQIGIEDANKRCCQKTIETIESEFGIKRIGQQLVPYIPVGSKVHLGIEALNEWESIVFSSSVEVFCNVGGYVNDGAISSLIGASLVNSNRIYFGFFRWQSLFYDMNVIGNRHVGNNVRILIMNDSKNTVNYIRQYVEDLGYEYLSCSSNDELIKVSDRFLSKKFLNRPILLEIFV